MKYTKDQVIKTPEGTWGVLLLLDKEDLFYKRMEKGSNGIGEFNYYAGFKLIGYTVIGSVIELDGFTQLT